MAQPPPGQSCGSCSYWITALDTALPAALPPNTGICNRYPPVPSNLGATASDAAWALTKDTYWCGEYKVAVPTTKPAGG